MKVDLRQSQKIQVVNTFRNLKRSSIIEDVLKSEKDGGNLVRGSKSTGAIEMNGGPDRERGTRFWDSDAIGMNGRSDRERIRGFWSTHPIDGTEWRERDSGFGRSDAIVSTCQIKAPVQN